MMSSDNFKLELFNQFARIGKALGNAYRLEIIEFLAQGERNVEELATLSGLSIANTSQHLQQLKQTGLVTATKKGQYVYYQLSNPKVIDLFAILRDVAEQTLAEVNKLVDTFLTVKDDLEPIPAKELLERARQGLVTVLDVRPPEEFNAGHLPQAINIPLKNLENIYHTLPKDKEIIAYCRGPYCILAYQAVAQLRDQGFSAYRLENGFPEWKQAGLPIE